MPSRLATWIFPLRGLFRGGSYQQQPPYSTPDCMNVRPYETLEGRARGGTRPGIVKSFQEELGSGAVLRTLTSVRYLKEDALSQWSQDWSDMTSDLDATLWETADFAADAAQSIPAISARPDKRNNGFVPLEWLSDFYTLNNTYEDEYPFKASYDIPPLASDWFTGPVNLWSGVADELIDPPVWRGVVRAAFTIDTSLQYQLEFDIPADDTYRPFTIDELNDVFANWVKSVPLPGYGAKYRFYLQMDDTSPDPLTSGGVVVQLQLSGTRECTYNGWLKTYDTDGTLLASNAFTTYGTIDDTETRTFRITITEANLATVVFGSTTVLSNVDLTANGYSPAGDRIGFAMASLDETEARAAWLTGFRIQYVEDAGASGRVNAVIASAGGSLYMQSFVGSLEEQTETDIRLSADDVIDADNYEQVVYLADHGPPLRKSTNTCTITKDGSEYYMTDGDITDWGDVFDGVEPEDYHVEFTSPGAGVAGSIRHKVVRIGVSNVDRLYITDWTLAPLSGESGSSDGYEIRRAPKAFYPEDGTLRHWGQDTDGTELRQTSGGVPYEVPYDCQHVARFRDRIVLADDHQWYMSAQGDPNDWDYATEGNDPGQAVSGALSDAGTLSDRITALIPFHDSYLLFGCAASLWKLTGDPGFGGRLDALSFAVGVIARGAWCWLPSGQVAFLSSDGLYLLAAGAMSVPEPISRDILPRELVNLDPENNYVSMAYNVIEQGIDIFVTPHNGGTGEHLFFDWRLKTFWPVSLQRDHEPSIVHSYTPDGADAPVVLMGGQDGYIRQYDRAASLDDGTSFFTRVVLGPFRMGSNVEGRGLLEELTGEVDQFSQSGDVFWSLRSGDDHESVLRGPVRASGQWAQGLNHKSRPRVSGRSVALTLANAPYLQLENGSYLLQESGDQVAQEITTQPWAFEQAVARIRPAGRHRL